jgi:hypothetical protein
MLAASLCVRDATRTWLSACISHSSCLIYDFQTFSTTGSQDSFVPGNPPRQQQRQRLRDLDNAELRKIAKSPVPRSSARVSLPRAPDIPRVCQWQTHHQRIAGTFTSSDIVKHDIFAVVEAGQTQVKGVQAFGCAVLNRSLLASLMQPYNLQLCQTTKSLCTR